MGLESLLRSTPAVTWRHLDRRPKKWLRGGGDFFGREPGGKAAWQLRMARPPGSRISSG